MRRLLQGMEWSSTKLVREANSLHDFVFSGVIDLKANKLFSDTNGGSNYYGLDKTSSLSKKNFQPRLSANPMRLSCRFDSFVFLIAVDYFTIIGNAQEADNNSRVVINFIDFIY